MPDEPTPWELKRTLDDMRQESRTSSAELRQEFREGFTYLRGELKDVVGREEFRGYQVGVQRDIDEIKATQVREQDERRTHRRWLWGAILVPIATMIATIVLFLQGGGGAT